MMGENKTLQAQITAHTAELEALKASFASDNASAIDSAVQARLAEATPAPAAPTEEQIAEAVKEKLAAAEAKYASERDEAIARAVEEATTQLKQDLATIRLELEVAKAAPPSPTTSGDAPAPVVGTSDEDVKKAIEAAVQSAKKDLEESFAKVKETMTAEASKREKDITERMTAALRKAQQQASAAAANPSSAPPPNVEALVKEKLAELEKERTATQVKAIEKAVNEALAKQKEAHAKLLQETKEQVEKQATMKHGLLQKTVQGLRQKLADNGISTGTAKPAATAPSTTPAAASTLPPSASALPPKPTPTNGALPTAPATAASTAQPASAVANRGGLNAGGRGGRGGAGRGGARGGGAGAGARGGKAAASPPVSSNAAAAGTSSQEGGNANGGPKLAVRGANARGGPGGVLGTILGAAGLAPASPGAAKRARESEGEGDQSKRPKPQ